MAPSVSPPFLSSRILVFSDFNCPYCFTLNEWIESLGASDQVRWVGIEHRPDLPTHGENTPKDIDLLGQEVADVQRRAPEVDAQKPSLWTNSREALLLQNAIEDDHPHLAPRLRQLIYRAYWQKNHWLSQKEQLIRQLETLSLDVPLTDTKQLEDHTAWWRTHLDRIPAMVAPNGTVHLGLQDLPSVRSFLNSALRSGEAGPGCR